MRKKKRKMIGKSHRNMVRVFKFTTVVVLIALIGVSVLNLADNKYRADIEATATEVNSYYGNEDIDKKSDIFDLWEATDTQLYTVGADYYLNALILSTKHATMTRLEDAKKAGVDTEGQVEEYNQYFSLAEERIRNIEALNTAVYKGNTNILLSGLQLNYMIANEEVKALIEQGEATEISELGYQDAINKLTNDYKTRDFKSYTTIAEGLFQMAFMLFGLGMKPLLITTASLILLLGAMTIQSKIDNNGAQLYLTGAVESK